MFMNKYNKDNKNITRITVALVGNPNSGKTTLFNALTGRNQKVGNWPGVTVERKSGVCRKDRRLNIVDTPGCYSLQPFTPEEQVTADFLAEKPDVILNVADSTNLERSLMLTTQLLELGIPTAVALNMRDEARAKGIEVDAKKLSEMFGCPFVSVSAAKKQGLSELVATTFNAAHGAPPPVKRYENAAQRYAQIESAMKLAVRKSGADMSLTDKIDKIVLNKWLAFPLLAAVLAAVFWLSAGGPVGLLTKLIDEKLTPLLQFYTRSLCAGAPQWLAALLCDGVIGGVMSVVSFVPQVTALFGCIALLEACGYMSRIAFVTDRLLNGLGLSGRSFVCMLLGCGCSVPAIVSARTVKDASERETTVTLTPFVPCSAKLAVIAFFTSCVFDGNALFAVSFYFAGLAAIIVGGLLLKLVRKDEKKEGEFLLELPPYRLPQAKNVLRQMWEKCKSFLTKAGTTIFAASVLLWFLTNFDFRLALCDTENSILARFGKIIAPLFAPLGFGDGGCGWQLAVATVSGIAAKETVIATLQILLPDGVQNAVSPLGAYSFVLYNLLTTPCIAAISASFSEQGCKKGLKSALFQTAIAYTFGCAVYNLGGLALHNAAVFAAVATAGALSLCAVFWLGRIRANGDFPERYAGRKRRKRG